MNQTRFFEEVGEALEGAAMRVAFLCFHERSHEYLCARGRLSFNAFGQGANRKSAVDLAAYAWPSLNLVLSHEKAAFEIYDSARLTAKLMQYLAACETALDELGAGEPGSVIQIQELGGFLSNVASFYAARRRDVDNVFIEPSFFRGRVFFVANTFRAPTVPGPRSNAVSAEVDAYLDETIRRQRVVIPVKDARHYRGPIEKLTDASNVRRLTEKFVDKYILGKREEFGHPAGHAARHVRMLWNARAFSRHYREMPGAGERFVYYPLHVPADVALTIRAPHYVDQYALVDYLARIVPSSHSVVIKEHPALVGASERDRLLALLTRRDNVRLIRPDINNYDVLRAADAVITVNSKSGAEALLLQRPVVVLGDAFYSQCSLVTKDERLQALPEALGRLLGRHSPIDNQSVRRYFQDVWDASYPGELYDLGSRNITSFARSLIHFVRHSSDASARKSGAAIGFVIKGTE